MAGMIKQANLFTGSVCYTMAGMIKHKPKKEKLTLIV
jgi:hypothetical protein